MTEEKALAVSDPEELKAKLAPFALKPETLSALRKIESICARYAPENTDEIPAIYKSLVVAKGLHELRDALTPDLVALCLMPLQGSKLGFKTDKQYSVEEVRDVALEAMLKGLRFTGNEINILGGNLYVTLEGYDRKVGELVTGLDLIPHAPELKNGGALVGFEASWYRNGKREELRCVVEKDKNGEVVDKRIPVRVNAGQIVDAIMGKAKRKMLARIYAKIMGGALDEVDAGELEGALVGPSIPVTEGKRMSLKPSTAQPAREPGMEG